MAGIPRLPAELITIVCQQAEFSVLKQLRLTSKVCNEYAEPELYRCVNLKVNLRSFERLRRVSQTPHLSHHVKNLVYDGRLLPWDIYSHHDWNERLFTSYEIRDGDLTGFDAQKKILHEIVNNVEKYYENFQRLLQEQKDIHRGETETTMLHNIFINLPRLRSIELVTGLLLPRKEIYLGPAESYEAALKAGLSETGRQTLVEPSFDEPHWYTLEEDRDDLVWPPASTFHIKRFLALKHSCHVAGRTIKCFSAGWIDTDLFAKKIALPPSQEMLSFCSSLTHLSLRFADWKRRAVDDGYAGRVSFVGCASNLESLDLVGLLVNYEDRDHVQFRDDKMWALSFPRLRRLGLSHYFIHGDDLRTFLKTHASTLKEVLLTDIVLTSGFFVTEDNGTIPFAAMDKGLERQEWAKVFDCMASDLQLKTLHLGGSRWKTEDAVPNLREQIVKYVVKGGPSPISIDNDKVMPFGMREGPPFPVKESLQSSSADGRVPYLKFLPESH